MLMDQEVPSVPPPNRFAELARQYFARQAETAIYNLKGDLTEGRVLLRLYERLLRDFLAGRIGEKRYSAALRGITVLDRLMRNRRGASSDLPAGELQELPDEEYERVLDALGAQEDGQEQPADRPTAAAS